MKKTSDTLHGWNLANHLKHPPQTLGKNYGISIRNLNWLSVLISGNHFIDETETTKVKLWADYDRHVWGEFQLWLEQLAVVNSNKGNVMKWITQYMLEGELLLKTKCAISSKWSSPSEKTLAIKWPTFKREKETNTKKHIVWGRVTNPPFWKWWRCTSGGPAWIFRAGCSACMQEGWCMGREPTHS